MIERRDLLKLAVGGALAQIGASPAAAQDNTPAPAPQPAAPQPFSFSNVVELARTLSKRPYKAVTADLPDAFSNLNYESYVGLRAKPEAAVWLNDNVGFAIEPLHRGFIFSNPMQIFTVENGVSTRMVYDPAKFDFGKVTPPQGLGDIGFSGFRVLTTGSGAPTAEVAIFQGANFFRAAARWQTMGAMARGLAIRTADAKGEEFPQFRAIWIEKPTLAAGALELYALREILEGAAARLAAQHAFPAEIEMMRDHAAAFERAAADPRLMERENRLLHEAIFRAARNRYLDSALRDMQDSLALLGPTTFGVAGRPDTASREHRAMVDAIAARDEEAAEKAARMHMRAALKARMRLIHG